ncbi:pentapeptide repeat-containing protein [Pseudanabaena sp. FACHB-1998]|uniref:pentapeptide repeat-containing protein n=1 Tax=Pseudanabaena sp. FACHB-1998 TaxID=2692858 RepID=UPI0016801F8E|nr:pentapeptide repeat-containing protein [Pseudanabaena sp. FACHB-1998]MBD2176672.1 pentapeptide repeat-containing protein [Pseudanabaena sp. FACHB-1998]
MSNQSYDYKGQDLQNQSFVGQDLSRIDFSGSDLRGCDFTKAILTGANFERVITGQTPQKLNKAIFSIVMGMIAMISVITIITFVVVTVDNQLFVWLGETYRKISSIFSTLLLFVLYFFQKHILEAFPKTSDLLGEASICLLFFLMLFLTISFAVISFSGAFLFLIPMSISAIVTFKVFTWLIESIKSKTGTSFKKANLNEANFSHALIGNTDFSFALMTGICIEGWVMDSYNRFTKSQCTYLYLQQQQRYPPTGEFQDHEWEKFLNSH